MTIRSAMYGDRVWRQVGESDHETQDGRKIVLGVWETACLVCGAPFRISSNGRRRSFLMATCEAHRLTRYESGRLTGRQQTLEARRAAFEAIKREKLSRSARVA